MLTVRDLHVAGLEPVAFDLSPGSCLAIQGPSGSGKSLLLRALADLDPNAGDVWLDGEPRHAVPAPTWRKRVVYLATDAGWWRDRVGDHFGDWAAIDEAVTTIGLPAACHDWSVARLSTGERQRLAFLRALSIRPRILLLDEPTSALDSAATAAVEAVMGEWRRSGLAVVWVTHDPAQAGRVAERTLVLRDGGLDAP